MASASSKGLLFEAGDRPCCNMEERSTRARSKKGASSKYDMIKVHRQSPFRSRKPFLGLSCA